MPDLGYPNQQFAADLIAERQQIARRSAPPRRGGGQSIRLRWKRRADRDGVGPRWPWYREPYFAEPYGNSAGEDNRKKQSCPIFIPGQSLIGRFATLASSSVT